MVWAFVFKLPAWTVNTRNVLQVSALMKFSWHAYHGLVENCGCLQDEDREVAMEAWDEEKRPGHLADENRPVSHGAIKEGTFDNITFEVYTLFFIQRDV